MDHELLARKWKEANTATQFALRNYARNPTESNLCYMTGYLACGGDAGFIDVAYWLAVINNEEATKELLHYEIHIHTNQ